MYTAADLRKGLKVILDNEPYVVVAFEFSKPGKGQSLYRTKLRSMITGLILDRTFREGDTFEPASLEERTMQYLYKEGDQYHLMDTQTFEQIIVSEETLGEAKNYLTENMNVEVLLFRENPIGIELPNFVNLRVIKTEMWVKGDTSKVDYKPATLETGYSLRVPPFVGEGELITIDTRTGEYSTRVKE
ncbi:MAG: elongation factor P [Deltaproteobacteria bacterium RBG_13_47_9]|nr:MAG: elongation factor P [Deltaproteobacteria bacterium RBG_13_47_9]